MQDSVNLIDSESPTSTSSDAGCTALPRPVIMPVAPILMYCTSTDYNAHV